MLANLEIIMEDEIHSIEALLGEIATRQVTAQEFEHVGYIQEIAKLTQEVLDIDARHGGDIQDTELDILRACLTKIKRRETVRGTRRK